MWRDPFDRFISCLVYVPREAYSTDLRVKFQRILMAAFDGTSAEFDVMLSEAMLARIHFTVRTKPGQIPAFERKDIERKLAATARRWDDELRDALVERARRGAMGWPCSSAGARHFPPTTATALPRATPCPTCANWRRCRRRIRWGWRCINWTAARPARSA